MRADDRPVAGWLTGFVTDFRRRLVSLLSFSFRGMDSATALTLLDPNRDITSSTNVSSIPSVSDDSRVVPLSSSEILTVHTTPHDLKRLEMYSRNMVDHHMVVDLLPALARLLFLGRLPAVHLSPLQAAIILAVGLQHRDIDTLANELQLPVSQALAFFNKTVRKLAAAVKAIVEGGVAQELDANTAGRLGASVGNMMALSESLREDQRRDTQEYSKTAKKKQSR